MGPVFLLSCLQGHLSFPTSILLGLAQLCCQDESTGPTLLSDAAGKRYGQPIRSHDIFHLSQDLKGGRFGGGHLSSVYAITCLMSNVDSSPLLTTFGLDHPHLQSLGSSAVLPR